MVLHMIGIGLDDERDITLKGLDRVKASDFVFLEGYTSRLNIKIEKLEELYGKTITVADRELVEKNAEKEILERAKDKEVAFLVIGDVFGATTHTDIYMRAREKGIRCTITHNASIMNVVSETGLELYKFGKTTSIPFPEDNYAPTTAYDVISLNKRNGLHTLVLLDIQSHKNRFMKIGESIEILLNIEAEKKKEVFTEETMCIGCARIGAHDSRIIYGNAKQLLKEDFGKPLHCLIVPGTTHFMEEEVLETFRL